MKPQVLALLVAIGIQPAFARSVKAGTQVIPMSVTKKGFEPSSLHAKPGTDVVLRITRKTDSTCATAIAIPSKKIKVKLPLNKPVDVLLGKLKKGQIRFACGAGMQGGKIIVE